MKMKVSGFLAFTILSISILSFGLTGAVNAQSDTIPLSVSTDLLVIQLEIPLKFLASSKYYPNLNNLSC